MPLTETKEILAAAHDWIAWGEKFNWVCFGCDDYDAASYHRKADPRGIPFTITRSMRQDIDAVTSK
jgi:hypothetical protein